MQIGVACPLDKQRHNSSKIQKNFC